MIPSVYSVRQRDTGDEYVGVTSQPVEVAKNTGKKRSEETKAKMSAARKAWWARQKETNTP